MISVADFRRVALSMPDAIEKAHMGHPDFRAANGRIFATLGVPGDEWAMVSLTPEQQAEFIQEWPGIFVPVKGGWGDRGATNVRLPEADEPTVREAIAVAWKNVTQPRTRRSSSGPGAPGKAARRVW